MSGTYFHDEAEADEAHLRRRLNRLCYGINMNFDLDCIAEVAMDTNDDNDQTLMPSSTATIDTQLLDDPELGKLFVKYIVKGNRILFCDKIDTWKDFMAENPILDIEQTKITCAELRDYFIKYLLPEIYSFDNIEEWERTFEMLELNENFQRVQSGYVIKTNINGSKKINMPILYDVDYKIDAAMDIDEEQEKNQRQETDDLPDDDPKFDFETQKSNPASSHFVVETNASAGAAAPNAKKPKLETEMSPENRALLSAVVGTDFEIFHNASIDKDEILNRFKKAREEFMKTGRITLNLNPQELISKLQKMNALRTAVEDVMNKRF